jgi:hypothetical protein
MKIHIPSQALQRGIIMPRDKESHGNYPSIMELLMKDPNPKVDENELAKRKAGEKRKKEQA